MAVVQCVTNQYLHDLANGRAFSGDTYKVALYLQASASLGTTTAVYTATGEITGTGYTAGGLTMTGLIIGQDATTGTAYLTWDDPIWSASNLTADSALIYDSSNSNHSIAVLSFGFTNSDASGNFRLYMPPVGTTAIVTIKRQ